MWIQLEVTPSQQEGYFTFDIDINVYGCKTKEDFLLLRSISDDFIMNCFKEWKKNLEKGASG